jgi:hypothetical protein
VLNASNMKLKFDEDRSKKIEREKDESPGDHGGGNASLFGRSIIDGNSDIYFLPSFDLRIHYSFLLYSLAVSML